MLDHSSSPADQLLLRLNQAVAAANEAEKTAETAKTELVSRSKVAGELLLEAKKLHPAVEDFKAFLKRVDGLKLSRAYDLMSVAGGRKTVEEIRAANRDRVKKHRKKKLPKPEPEELSVTSAPVTETAEASAERKADRSAEENADTSSASCLVEFTYACHHWLPKMTEVDRQKALQLVSDIVNPKAEAA